MSNTFYPDLLRLRARLVPEDLQLGWMPFLLLGYLAFLFLPSFFGTLGGRGEWDIPYGQLAPTLISIAIFLPIYFLAYRSKGFRAIACMLAIAGLSYLLLPINGFANTYVIYAVAFAAFVDSDLIQRIGWMVAMLAAFLVETLLLGIPLFVFALTAILAIAVFFSNHFQIENARKRIALNLSYDEVRRLAALAERERIGRDLHDLLGHTLSLIALKSELAGKLIDRDVALARREVDDVTRIARDALSQVRRAVTGIRAAGLASELASARELLESDGIAFEYSLGEVEISADQETVLALVVREGITNIHRHARARHAAVFLDSSDGELRLRIGDDGRGSSMIAGNGLKGMRERVDAIGGRLSIDSGNARGTRVEVRMNLVGSQIQAQFTSTQSTVISH